MRHVGPAAFLTLIAGLALVGGLSAPPAAAVRTPAGPILPRPGLLHALFAADQPLVADYFWILTTHQIGVATTPDEFRDAYGYADLATDLDPWFRSVYWFAGVAIPVPIDRDRYANAEESTAILRKGAARFPDDFRINYQLAQNLIYFHKQFNPAAELLKRISTLPDAPDWLPGLATRLYVQGGDYEASVALTRHLIDTAPDENARKQFQHRLAEIRQEGILKQIDFRASQFKKQKGRPPKDINELQDGGFLTGMPPDPLGGAYYLDDRGLARSTASKYRFELITPEMHQREEAWDGGSSPPLP